jgi:hypothetical protein
MKAEIASEIRGLNTDTELEKHKAAPRFQCVVTGIGQPARVWLDRA